MTAPSTSYHALQGRIGMTGDSENIDLDDDLDLNELDPHTTSNPSPQARRQQTSSRYGYRPSGRIPLRNLRFGGRRRPRDEDADDLAILARSDVEDDEGAGAGRQSIATSGYSEGQDDDPLLANGHTTSRRPSQQPVSDFVEYASRKRAKSGLWGFILTILRGRNGSSGVTSHLTEQEDDYDSSTSRQVAVGAVHQAARFPPNAVSNAKYTPWSFLPRTLWNEFKFFFNMYFLLVALSQIIPALRIGYLSTYVVPLAFVISITLSKEAYDDLYRRKRDNDANSEPYKTLRFYEGDTNLPSKKHRVEDIVDRKHWKQARDSAGKEIGALAHARGNSNAETPSSRVVEIMKPSRDLKVGDVIVLNKDQRVPADVVILKSYTTESVVTQDVGMEDSGSGIPSQSVSNELSRNESTTLNASEGGEAFIRTDQLDGETDWKLRMATPLLQTLPASEYLRLTITAGKPDKKVNDFIGTIELASRSGSAKRPYDPHLSSTGQDNPSAMERPTRSAPLNIDNTAWANTVLASSTTVHAVIIYTGPQTRAALSTSPSRSKTGLLEYEINALTKILCFLTAALSIVLVGLERFEGASEGHRKWYVAFMRFLILFSTIVPISLRVNLDMGKSVFAYLIHRDQGIPGTVVRTSNIPEDLGRIEYLLSDKTGTLTRNEMELKKIHVGTVSYGGEAMEEVASYVRQAFALSGENHSEELFSPSSGSQNLGGSTRTRREIGLRVRDLVLALALAHNVTPTTEEDVEGRLTTAYQASSPDEIAIVQWTEHVGLRLSHRDRRTITLQSAHSGNTVVKVEILNVFPFTSESKRMGIIVRFLRSTRFVTSEGEGDILFLQKGADTVMSSIVAANDWLDEETANMAREGLRTLVIGRKTLNAEQYSSFASAYHEAGLTLDRRDAKMTQVIKHHLESNLELLGVTGVEDKLQPDVKPSLELLRNAGIKIWMLTGDKVETARCVAVSSKLVSRGQHIHTIANMTRKETALDALSPLHGRNNAALLIDGQSLALYLKHHRDAFITLAVQLPAVIACRCSPTQKADIALLIRAFTKKRIACIGDGGNDVSMIQAADVGVGIVGKEGRQASLAADFSITQFAYLTKLLVWHGRNSYKRSAKLAQFIIHRGLIISVCQTVFSIASAYEPIALYRDWLLVGYATVYTMMPVFSLVLDRDVDEGLANLYPELYKELTSGKSLSYRTFFVWCGISLYQGLIIQGGSEILVPGYSTTKLTDSGTTLTASNGFKRMVALSYTVLILNEILMVALSVTTWHPMMIFSIAGTLAIYFGSLPFLGGYFDLAYLITLSFWWRFAAVSAASLIPVYAGKIIGRTVRPPSYRKGSLIMGVLFRDTHVFINHRYLRKPQSGTWTSARDNKSATANLRRSVILPSFFLRALLLLLSIVIMPFTTVPSAATLQPQPFQAHVSDSDLNDFLQLLKLSRVGPKTYENQVADVKSIEGFGVLRSWLEQAKSRWETSYNWRKTEDRINSFPNFTVPIEEDGYEFKIHFVALFSKKKGAVPLTLLHGWPGSFLEFLSVLDVFRQKYGEDDLPYHLIVPSLPGYGYSSGPSTENNFTTEGIAHVIDKLMVGLGFGSGYVAQGGDMGSFVSRVLGATADACKAVHLNFCSGIDNSKENPPSTLPTDEQQGLERGSGFHKVGNAYARAHATRPSTIGLLCSTSPLALLAWVGEKFLQWTDEDPPMDEILDSATLYWFTDSLPRSIYPYRQFYGVPPKPFHSNPTYYINKPLGYSWHHKEIAPIPVKWVESSGDLVWHRKHQEGGHFAAMEKPSLFVKDIEDFVNDIKMKAKL
nr:putative phospholipid-transporting atpase neo1 [Quercus suber]